MKTLVIGASGHVGAVVLRELLAAGVDLRASSRSGRIPGLGPDVEQVATDLEDPSTLPAALDGVDKAFVYARPGTLESFAAAARAAGVAHVVLLSSVSVVMPSSADNPIARFHQEAERVLTASGLATTFVRPAYFATNTLRWTSIRTDRVLRTAFPEATTSMVHEADIGGVAARALLDDALVGATPAVLGPGPSTTAEQVTAIATALGEPVRLEVIDVETYRQEQLRQLPAPIVDVLIAARGDVAPAAPEVATDATAEVLGRPALGFDVWAADHAEDFR